MKNILANGDATKWQMLAALAPVNPPTHDNA
jgi:hypothetical protein